MVGLLKKTLLILISALCINGTSISGYENRERQEIENREELKFIVRSSIKTKKIINIETPILNPYTRHKGIANLVKIASYLIWELNRYPNRSIAEKLAMSYELILNFGYDIYAQYDSAAIMRDFANKTVDCDSLSYLLLIVAEYYGWEVGLVLIPNHAFLYYQGLFIDYNDKTKKGIIRTDADYYIVHHGYGLPEYQRESVLRPQYGEKVYANYLANVGIEEYYNGNYDASIRYLDRALSIYPYDAVWYHLRGKAYYRKAEHIKAVREFKKSIKLQPNRPVYLYNLSRVYSKLDFHENALHIAEESIKYDHRNRWRHYLNLGRCYMYVQQYHAAMRSLNMSLELRNTNSDTWYLKGLAAFHIGDEIAAEKHIQKAEALGFTYGDRLKYHELDTTATTTPR